MIFSLLRSKCALMMTVSLLVLGNYSDVAADSISLAWDSNNPSVGYKVHIGTQSGSYSQHIDVGPSKLYNFSTATAGQRYCFAVSAYLLSSQLEGPNSSEVCGYSNQAPTLVNPGARTSTVGQPTTLQLQGADPDGEPLTFSVSGLPTGLTLGSSTGFISGVGTAAGTFTVTARSNDGVLSSAAQTFTWTMTAPAGDTTRPAITITTPTSAATFSTTSSTINLGGSSSDNQGVTQVRWSNDRGGSGVATGTTSWSISGLTLQSGANVISVTAVDAAGNQATASLTVTRSTTSTDTTKPTTTIASPTTATAFSTTSSTISLSGSAADNVAVTQVRWTNDRGGSGVATGTTSWSAASIPLLAGTNVITITAVDAAGNTGSDTLSVTYSGTTSPTASLRVQEGTERRSVELAWTNASWTSVDVYRDGVKIKNTRNDGSTSDSVTRRGTYSYKVCAPNSTTTCSNIASLYVR